MKLVDRYIIRNFLFNYLLAFMVLVGMYILLDLIVNFDQFTRANPDASLGAWISFWGLLAEITSFYMYRTLVIFQQISGVIPLLAAGFTMVRMTRQRELTALLASGVSLYRLAVPIIICAIGFSLLVVVDQEVLMPRFVGELLRSHGSLTEADVQPTPIYFLPESDNSLVLASRYNPQKRKLYQVRIIERNKAGIPTARIVAKTAIWHSHIGEGLMQGGWVMHDVIQYDQKHTFAPDEIPVPVKSMVYYTPLNPHQLRLIFEKKAVDYLSTAQVNNLMLNSPPSTRLRLQKIMYVRFSQIVMNFLMLLIGIPFLLTREPSKLVGNMLYCTVVSGLCFVATFVCFQLAGTVLSPLVGAWLPVLIFAPVAIAMLDLIQT